jgi:hypothetical protein
MKGNFVTIDAGAFRTRKEAAAHAATVVQAPPTADAVTFRNFGDLPRGSRQAGNEQGRVAHASLEQTSTYLNVTRVGLHESMRRFDANVARCNPVANEATIEHLPVINDGAHRGTNTLLQ